MLGELLMAKALMEAGGEGMVSPSNAEAGSFQHIGGLKVGDKLRFKGGSQKTPKKGDVVTVYTVLDKAEVGDKAAGGTQIYRFDFTALFETGRDGDQFLLVYYQDSRYYERVSVA